MDGFWIGLALFLVMRMSVRGSQHSIASAIVHYFQSKTKP